MMSCAGGERMSYTLATGEDVRHLRLQFLSRLLVGYVPAASTLEMRTSSESIAVLFPDSATEHTTPERLLHEPTITTYKQVVWFNGLNWARPRHHSLLAAMRSRLRPGGRLFLSCAAHFMFLNESAHIEMDLANRFRVAAGLDRVGQDFGDLRFSVEELRRLLYGLRIVRLEHIEADVDLALDAFNEWHCGSVKCLLGDATDHTEGLREQYLGALHDLYRGGGYRPRLGSVLVVAEVT